MCHPVLVHTLAAAVRRAAVLRSTSIGFVGFGFGRSGHGLGRIPATVYIPIVRLHPTQGERRRERLTRWYASNGFPFRRRAFACRYPPRNHAVKKRKKAARITHLIITPVCVHIVSMLYVGMRKEGLHQSTRTHP